MEGLNIIPDEFLSPLVSCFDFLKRCNILFFNDNISVFRKYWRFLYIIPCVLTFHLSQMMTMVRAFKGELDLYQLAYVVPVYVVCTQAILKAIVVTSNKAEVRAIVLELGAMWRTDDLAEEQISKKNVMLKRLKFCYTAFYWMNILGSWQYIVTPILETLFRKYVLGQDCELLLAFICTYPFDATNNWVVYILIYAFESYSMFRIVYLYLGTELLMITLCAHLSTQFTLLREDLLRVKPVGRNSASCDVTHDEDLICMDEISYSLEDVIKRHQQLIKLSQQLDDVFNKMIFIDLSSATVVICFFGFAAKVARGAVDMANNFIGAFVSILPIFNLCYYGELLRDSSAGIADSAYENQWYIGNTLYQKSIQFIILRSQKACCLTSLKYNPITLNTFTTVLSTTWSYFSLANSMCEEN